MLKKHAYKSIEEIKNQFIDLYGELCESQAIRYQDLLNRFCEEFGQSEGYFASSSGRVEICGNHTDHNGGKVLSCAISLDTLAVFMPTNDNKITIKSQGYPKIRIDLNDETFDQKGTSGALVKGVCVALKNNGYKVGGFCASITSNVLGGAGISSSASFEVLIAEILNFLYNNGKISKQEKAKFAQFAENVYFGKPCGLLDQTAIAFGGLNKLDFSDKNQINVKRVDNALSDYTLVLINTGGSHADLTDEYASIPNEMYSVANFFNKDRLIDVNEADFYSKINQIEKQLGKRPVLRAVHFFEENKRVEKAVQSLINENYSEFLDMIDESGESSLNKLQNCFVENSKDRAIPNALKLSKKFLYNGANRVHGGGFAGCILCFVANENKEKFVCEMKKHYNEKDILILKVRSVGTLVL